MAGKTIAQPGILKVFVTEILNRVRDAGSGGSDQVMACLMAYESWYPGNVRELENIIEQAFVLCRGGRIEKNQTPEILIRFTLKHLDQLTRLPNDEALAALRRHLPDYARSNVAE